MKASLILFSSNGIKYIRRPKNQRNNVPSILSKYSIEISLNNIVKILMSATVYVGNIVPVIATFYILYLLYTELISELIKFNIYSDLVLTATSTEEIPKRNIIF